MDEDRKSHFSIACPDDLGELHGAVGGFQCGLCGRHFTSIEGIVELLPREALQDTSPENSQLNTYRTSFSNRPERAWRHSLGTLLHLLGNRYLYSWAVRALEKIASGRSFAVLDAGSGEGIFVRYLSNRHRYVGIDFSARPLVRAQRYHPATYFRADLNHLPFPDAVFDAVISFQALQYLDRPEAALAQMARVLRPTGTLLLTVPNDESFKYRRQGIPRIQLQRFNHKTLLSLLAPAFEVLHAKTRGFWVPAPVVSLHVPGVYPTRWGLSWTIAATLKK